MKDKTSFWMNAFVLLFVTVIIPGLIFWAQWSVNTKLANERMSEDIFNATTYSTKKDLESTNGKLDRIQETVLSTARSVSAIEGAMDSEYARKPKAN